MGYGMSGYEQFKINPRDTREWQYHTRWMNAMMAAPRFLPWLSMKSAKNTLAVQLRC